MGLNKLVELAKRLTEQSIPGDTCVQITSKVSQPEASVLECTLESINQAIETQKPPMPALVIIGKNVVRLNESV